MELKDKLVGDEVLSGKIKIVEKPRIDIDKYAVRFISSGRQANMFWQDLFAPGPYENFQREIMLRLKELYEECVRQNIDLSMDESEDDD